LKRLWHHDRGGRPVVQPNGYVRSVENAESAESRTGADDYAST